jgi:hypothetical protein
MVVLRKYEISLRGQSTRKEKMSTFRLWASIAVSMMVLMVASCEDDDRGDHHHGYYWNDGCGCYVESYPSQQPIQTEAYVSLSNQSSIPVVFTVNGQTMTVNSGYSATWPYQGTANVSAMINDVWWSYTWYDNADHYYTAVNNGTGGISIRLE